MKEKSTPNWARWVGLVAVLLCTSWTLWATTKAAYDAAPQNTLRYEWIEKQSNMPHDARLILRGVENKSFSDTLSFWAGSWALEQNKFYRPIPSLLWWGMYHGFGDNLAAFLGVLALSHVIATLILWRFLCYLFRDETFGTLAACCFALGLAYHLFRLATPAYALDNWIDHVEPWLLIPYAGCLWAFIKYLRDGGKWLIVSLALFVVTICIKEAAYTLPMMALALLWYERKLPQWKVLLPFGAVAVCGLIYRTWAIGGTGTKFGSNGSWMQRALVEIGGGLPMALVHRHEFLPFLVAGVLAGVLMFYFKRYRAAALFGVVAVAGTVAAAIKSSGMDDAFYYQLLGNTSPWEGGIAVALWFLVVYQIAANPQREQRFGLLWAVISYSVLLAAPTTLHTLYIVSIGWGICLAGAVKVLLPYATPLHTSSSREAASATTRAEALSPS